MGFQWFNNWPYSYSYLPSMDDHVDPVNHTFFDGMNQAIYSLQYYLGFHPQGAYANVSQRLASIESSAGKEYATFVVSPTGAGADYSNIQDAIDAVEALGGGRVLIMEGTYTIASQLTVNGSDDIVIQGMGPKTVITSSSSLSHLMQVCDIGNQHDRIYIKDICFDGNSGNSGSAGLLFFQYTDYSFAINCYFKDSNGYSMNVEASDFCTISGCQFGVAGNNSLESDPTSNNLSVINCNFTSVVHSGYCVVLDGTCSVCVACTFLNVANGVYQYGAGTLVTSCTFKTLSSRSVRCYGAYGIFSNNYIQDADGEAVQVEGQHCSVVGNTFYDNHDNAIRLMGDYISCVGNSIKTNGSDGINVAGTHNSVIGNTIEEVTGNGINNNGSRMIISGNSIYNCTNAGLLTYSDTDLIITNNVIYNNGVSGMWIRLLTHGTISGNTIHDNNQQGIYLQGCTMVAITGNSIHDNGKGAGTYCEIKLDSSGATHSTYNTVTGNTIDATANEYGVREQDANQDYNLVVGNIAQNASIAQISLQGVNSVQANNI